MIAFVVPGHPQPKQRPRFGRHSVYTPQETKDYETFVGYCAKRVVQGKMLRGPVRVRIVVWCKGNVGDLDNLAKAILDGMAGVVYEDDRQVVHLEVTKRRDSNERVEVLVEEAKEESA